MARRDAETQMDPKRQKAATKMPRRPMVRGGPAHAPENYKARYIVSYTEYTVEL